MSDIVEKLRAENDRLRRTKKALRHSRDCWLMKVVEQSDEIEKLRAALRECDAVPLPPEVRAVVRAALGGEHEP